MPLIIAVAIGSTLILYTPFILSSLLPQLTWPTGDMRTIYANFDGLYYLVPAVSWYDPDAIAAMRLEFDLPLEYYAAHLPLYPALIALFSPVWGLLKSMIFVSVMTSAASAVLLYQLVRRYAPHAAYPLALLFVYLMFPRFFIVRSVGAPEGLFIALILSSILAFETKRYALAGLLGGLSAMTKTPGVLLFVAYGLVFFEHFVKTRKFSLAWFWILLIPLGLASVFSLYAVQYGNFFAYFATGGVVPMPYPFSVFDARARWVDTVWLEDILFTFFLYGSAVIALYRSKFRSVFYFPLVFFIAAIFVQHRDLSRYMLPLWPFAILAFHSFFTSKRFVLLGVILLPAIFLYAWNFLQGNVIPVADWRPFL